MKIKTNMTGDGPGAVVASVDVTLDNGDWFRLYEERPSASRCELRVLFDGRAIAVSPLAPGSVQIGSQ